MNRKTTIILIILIAGILLFLGYQKRATVLPFISNIIKSQPDLEDKEADHTLEASALYAAYQEDENKANEKYKEKIIVVSGTISEINEQSLIIGGEMGGINCTLKEEAQSQLSAYKKGDNVKIKGLCVGMGLFDVSLTKCVFVK